MAKTGAHMKHKIMLIFPSIAAHIRFSQCMSPISWLTPTITRGEEINVFGVQEQDKSIVRTPAFHAVYVTLRLQRCRSRYPIDTSMEVSPKP